MIFSLIFCLLTMFQISCEKPISHLILEQELDKEFNVLNTMLYGTVYYLEEINPLQVEEAYEKFFAGDFVRMPLRAQFNKGYQKSDY